MTPTRRAHVGIGIYTDSDGLLQQRKNAADRMYRKRKKGAGK